ncbi:hypothetical protein F5883DRAFT_205453 [Diaporthe sp. PMI_573]|nr:hypothetical protein F5883DRAFT_205453 [Diaporthaceae sp. PMI_573]
MARKRSSSAAGASVARGSTVIREVNKIRRKGPKYSNPKNADREFWSQTLSPAEFAYLLKRVHKNQELGDYFDKELRYEYSTSKKHFTILMSMSAFHGTFVGGFKDLLTSLRVYIEHGTKGYERTPEALRRVAANIKPRGNAAIYFDKVLDRKHPDGSYFFRGCKQAQPSLAVEVSWSHHDSQELAERARELISLSNGKIRTVVSVNLHDIYKESDEGKALEESSEGPAAATASVWRAHLKDVNGQQELMAECDYDEAFRDSGGNAVDSFKLCLFLSDFMCEDHVIRNP